jgi:hypothetical protein
MKHYINIAASWLVANEMGLGRMNPWVGLFVLAVLWRPHIKMILKEL